MKSSDRAILLGLGILGLLAAFWFLAFSPKREEAGELDEQITELQASIAEQEALAAAGEAAQKSFGGNYRELVALGKAVPEGEDTSSLIVQLEGISERAGTDLRVIALSEGATAAPAPPAAETTAEPTPSGSESSESTPVATPRPAPATETAAATLPLGATVGPAGLPVMPYSLSLNGTYFEVAKFLEGLDKLVDLDKGKPAVDGRLLTVDGFSLAPSGSSDERLEIEVLATSYVAPADQGLTAGATPTGPAPAGAGTATPTSTSTAPVSP